MTTETTPKPTIIDALYLPNFPSCTMAVLKNGNVDTVDITAGEYRELCRALPVVYEDGGYVKFDVDIDAQMEIVMNLDKSFCDLLFGRDDDMREMDEEASRAHWAQYGVL